MAGYVMGSVSLLVNAMVRGGGDDAAGQQDWQRWEQRGGHPQQEQERRMGLGAYGSPTRKNTAQSRTNHSRKKP